MTSQEQVEVCLVGAGRMGKIRASLLYARPDVHLTTVVDIAEQFGQSLASQYHAQWCPTISEALRDNQALSAVFVSTPTHTHIPTIRAIIQHAKVQTNKRPLFVFVEKPVAETTSDISTVFEEAADADVTILCGFQRRFDKSYTTVKDKIAAGVIGDVKCVRVFFADHPMPSMDFLATGGDPFMDLAPHDLDYVRWVLGADPSKVWAQGSSSTAELSEKGILDNATASFEFPNGVVCSMFLSRGATYGYDQRVEFFGSKGVLAVENRPETTAVLGDAGGIHHSRLDYSFPQRFKEAFTAEVEHAIKVCRGEATWPITVADCLAAQGIAAAAMQSARQGQPVPVDNSAWRHANLSTKFVVRAIGNGEFGSYIREIVGSKGTIPGLELVAPFTRRSGLEYDTDVLGHSNGVDGIYVCSPDRLHLPQALECLRAGKHVLVEKPVYPKFSDISKVLSTASTNLILMVGFHRRFAAEFQRARTFIASKQSAPSCIVVSHHLALRMHEPMHLDVRYC